jgi:hypothetical protein
MESHVKVAYASRCSVDSRLFMMTTLQRHMVFVRVLILGFMPRPKSTSGCPNSNITLVSVRSLGQLIAFNRASEASWCFCAW